MDFSALSNLDLPGKKKPAAAAASAPDVPQVPVERLVSSPKRVKGKGRRDTVLTGEDGLP